jgi:hypothetical protein
LFVFAGSNALWSRVQVRNLQMHKGARLALVEFKEAFPTSWLSGRDDKRQ